MSFIVGIDEAGRGPLAGPVAVGAVKIRENFDKKLFIGLKDSKQLSPEERELWFSLIRELRREGHMDFAVSLVSERVIDRRGIAYAIRLGIKRCLEKIQAAEDTQVFLDGGIKAPAQFVHQLTVVKGDEKIPVISLASICAKVVRDRRMVRLATAFPEFNFHTNKGYGTWVHREALLRHGPTHIHRQSFIKNLKDWPQLTA